MARGGRRAGAGRPKRAAAAPTIAAIEQAAAAESKTPLEYMLDVLNDPKADAKRRDQMAVSAAPYVHVAAGKAIGGKKAQDQQKADAIHSRFRGVGPPTLKAVP